MTISIEPLVTGTVIGGTAGDDFILGLDGDDTINAAAGHDYVDGRAGDDIISGGDGHDIIVGAEGDDQLSGDAGDDILIGESGNDVISGGAGVDAIDGGVGNDTLSGGEGQDHFQFDIGYNSSGADNWGNDVITDFDTAEDMLYIAVAAGDANALTVTDTADGALVSYNNGGSISTILLEGVLAAELGIQADFSDPYADPYFM